MNDKTEKALGLLADKLFQLKQKEEAEEIQKRLKAEAILNDARKRFMIFLETFLTSGIKQELKSIQTCAHGSSFFEKIWILPLSDSKIASFINPIASFADKDFFHTHGLWYDTLADARHSNTKKTELHWNELDDFTSRVHIHFSALNLSVYIGMDFQEAYDRERPAERERLKQQKRFDELNSIFLEYIEGLVTAKLTLLANRKHSYSIKISNPVLSLVLEDSNTGFSHSKAEVPVWLSEYASLYFLMNKIPDRTPRNFTPAEPLILKIAKNTDYAAGLQVYYYYDRCSDSPKGYWGFTMFIKLFICYDKYRKKRFSLLRGRTGNDICAGEYTYSLLP